MDYKKILVIQGPIKSKGRSGKTDNFLEKLTHEDIITYDCEENINQVYESYGYLFDEVILSTWINEDTKLINSGIKILKNNIINLDNYYIYKGKVKLKDNKYRQIYSTVKALEAIKFGDNSLVLKIRTDQNLRIDKIIDYLKKVDLKYIYFPYISKDGHLPDFYFAGKLNKLKDLLYCYLKSEEIYKSIHNDLPLRFASKKYKLPVWMLKSKAPNITVGGIIGARLTLLKFRGLPEDIYQSICWRGEPIKESKRGLPNTALKFGVLPQKKKITKIRFFLTIIFINFKCDKKNKYTYKIIDILQNHILYIGRKIDYARKEFNNKIWKNWRWSNRNKFSKNTKYK